MQDTPLKYSLISCLHFSANLLAHLSFQTVQHKENVLILLRTHKVNGLTFTPCFTEVQKTQ